MREKEIAIRQRSRGLCQTANAHLMIDRSYFVLLLLVVVARSRSSSSGRSAGATGAVVAVGTDRTIVRPRVKVVGTDKRHTS